MATNVSYHYDENDTANNRIEDEEEDDREAASDKESESGEDSGDEDEENQPISFGKRKRSSFNWHFKEEFETLEEARELPKTKK